MPLDERVRYDLLKDTPALTASSITSTISSSSPFKYQSSLIFHIVFQYFSPLFFPYFIQAGPSDGLSNTLPASLSRFSSASPAVIILIILAFFTEHCTAPVCSHYGQISPAEQPPACIPKRPGPLLSPHMRVHLINAPLSARWMVAAPHCLI